MLYLLAGPLILFPLLAMLVGATVTDGDIPVTEDDTTDDAVGDTNGGQCHHNTRDYAWNSGTNSWS